jgi:hypothetical protein
VIESDPKTIMKLLGDQIDFLFFIFLNSNSDQLTVALLFNPFKNQSVLNKKQNRKFSYPKQGSTEYN